MPITRILYRINPAQHEETGLAVTTIDLETAGQWLRLMKTASETLRESDEFVRIIRRGAPLRFYLWPGSSALPNDSKFIGFTDAATSADRHGSGVEVPGPLPVPDLDHWKVYERETSFHLREDEPVLEWRIEPEYYPGMYHVGGVTGEELLRIQRKLRCYGAKPDEQRRLFREIEEDDPELADRMLAECELLRRSFIAPDTLLRPGATSGRFNRHDEG